MIGAVAQDVVQDVNDLSQDPVEIKLSLTIVVPECAAIYHLEQILTTVVGIFYAY